MNEDITQEVRDGEPSQTSATEERHDNVTSDNTAKATDDGATATLGERGRAALSYKKLGLAVVAVMSRGKRPTMPGWQHDPLETTADVIAQYRDNPDDNVGLLMGSGLVCIDLDVDKDKGRDGIATLDAWEKVNGKLPETVCELTGRGGRHLIYRTDRPIRPSTGGASGVDIRGDGSYIVVDPSVHPNGNRYSWVRSPENCEIAEADDNVYAFVESVQQKKTTMTHSPVSSDSAIHEGERNDRLFRLACSMQAKGLADDEIEREIRQQNESLCDPPLDDTEVETIIGSALRYEKGTVKDADESIAGRRRLVMAAHGITKDDIERCYPHNDKGERVGGPRHAFIGELLVNKCHACTLAGSGTPAIWTAGACYELGWDGIDRIVCALFPEVGDKGAREIQRWLALSAPKRPVDTDHIAFLNGDLDVKRYLAGKGDFFSERTPDVVIICIIPHEFHPDAEKDDLVDAFVDSLAQSDPAYRNVFGEIIGQAMNPRSHYQEQVCFIVGLGGTGKTTLVRFLKWVIGEANVSELGLAELSNPTTASMAAGKLLNVADDISSELTTAKGVSTLKNAVSGGTQIANEKYKQPYMFRVTAFILMTANKMPRVLNADMNSGLIRRLYMMRLTKTVSKGDANYVARLDERMRTEHAAEYAIRLGIEGLARVMAQGGLSVSGTGDALLNEVITDSDSVMAWVDDCQVTIWDLVGFPTRALFDPYKAWCADANRKPVERGTFTRALKEGFNLDVKPIYSSATRRTARAFVTETGACQLQDPKTGRINTREFDSERLRGH